MGVLVRFARINPLKVTYYWPLFEHGLMYSSPPGTIVQGQYVNNILTGCLTGKMQAWLCFDKGENTYRPVGTVITRLDQSLESGRNCLVIESLFGFGGVPGDAWKLGMSVLIEFARQQGCEKVIGTTHSDRVKEIVQALDCKTTYTVLEWEVE